MSTSITVRLPEFYAERLEQLAEEEHLSKTDLILEGLRGVFASRLDRKIIGLTDAQFAAAMDILTDTAPPEVLEKQKKLMNAPYPWESGK